MKRLALLVPLLAALAALSACGEKPQTLGSNRIDVAPYQGAQNEFVAPGWKATDKGSWEQGLKTRMQNSQNEYTKIN
ncbi:MAG: putative lipoprotein [Polaromonas sp.]|nr:putative lipoprotein [Polaromonas sp.]